MKKVFLLFVIIICMVVIAGCGEETNTNTPSNNTNKPVEEVVKKESSLQTEGPSVDELDYVDFSQVKDFAFIKPTEVTDGLLYNVAKCQIGNYTYILRYTKFDTEEYFRFYSFDDIVGSIYIGEAFEPTRVSGEEVKPTETCTQLIPFQNKYIIAAVENNTKSSSAFEIYDTKFELKDRYMRDANIPFEIKEDCIEYSDTSNGKTTAYRLLLSSSDNVYREEVK